MFNVECMYVQPLKRKSTVEFVALHFVEMYEQAKLPWIIYIVN